ncbi:lipoprotein [Spiroplasma sp. DGKH1]|uniref:lipoprotein n=1 Tax=Spiroplasma sp. DGKH1 TaxID=3050074 RepID=UPI0034C6CD51
MRKLLSIFTVATLITTSASSLIACKAGDGQLLPMFIYNGDKGFDHNPTASETEGVLDPYSSTADTQYSLNGGTVSLQTNIALPFLYGLNLTDDNSGGQKGAKWSKDQINSGLKAQKDKLISSATGDAKTAWESFFNNYSTTADSFYTQVALVNTDNPDVTIYGSNPKQIVQKTSNYEKTTDKNYVSKNAADIIVTKDSLNVLTPIKQVVDWLNTPANNFNTQAKDASNDKVLQSTRYVLVEIPSLTFTFEFTNQNNIYTFKSTVQHVTGVINYLSYRDPNSKDDAKAYGHQWFFVGYNFYDLANTSAYQDDDYHQYRVKMPIPFADKVTLAQGFVNKGDPVNPIKPEDASKVGSNGVFKVRSSNYSIPDLMWTIDPNSIKYNH